MRLSRTDLVRTLSIIGVTSVLPLTLVLATPSAGEAQVLRPSELCSDHPDAAIATFEDANLEARVRSGLGLDGQDDLTCGLLPGVAYLNPNSRGIVSLAGIQNLTSLTRLALGSNAITDISALSGLTGLTYLFLYNNPDLRSIQPLLDNTGLGAGDTVLLSNVNPAMPCSDVILLRARGVRVTFTVCT